MVATRSGINTDKNYSGTSGREFGHSEVVPFLALNAAQKRVLPEGVLKDIATTPETSLKRLQGIEVLARDGAAIRVASGSLIRLTLTAGPQVAEINVWNADNPSEHLDISLTRQIHSSHLTTGDSLWSRLPHERPLLTLTADSLGYGIDEDGAGVHDVIGSRCDPYTLATFTGQSVEDTCHSNLFRAVRAQGLKEGDIHDAFNAFTCSGFSKDTGVYFVKQSPARLGDYIDFFAQVNVIFAVSSCRQGGNGSPIGDDSEHATTSYPMGVDVYEIPKTALNGWSPPQPRRYVGTHGIIRICRG